MPLGQTPVSIYYKHYLIEPQAMRKVSYLYNDSITNYHFSK